MAEFDKVILPGGKGKIRLQIETEGYQGNIKKSARVYTNEPEKKPISLRMKAFVKVPIKVSPRYVYLSGPEGKSITRVVEIKAELEKPLVLNPVQFNLDEKLEYTLEETEKGKRFHVNFRSNPGVKQAYRGFLKFKTNYPEKPELIIQITGRVVKKKSG